MSLSVCMQALMRRVFYSRLDLDISVTLTGGCDDIIMGFSTWFNSDQTGSKRTEHEEPMNDEKPLPP